jgi:drug/metabolite transporter (DMT)-like permease
VWIFLGALLGVILLAQKSSPFGLLMIAGAAITEAIIYFIILKLPSKNSWNHLFLSYFAGALLLSAFYRPAAASKSTMVALGINSIIGMFGYVLRFFAVSRLPVFWYALLSNLGVAFSYLYGYLFHGEVASVRQIIGTAIVLLTCWFAK